MEGDGRLAYRLTFAFGELIKADRLLALLPEFKVFALTMYAVCLSAGYALAKVRPFIDHLASAFGAEPE